VSTSRSAHDKKELIGDHNHDHDHSEVKDEQKVKDVKKKWTSNINLDAAMLHVIGDCIMSIGVIIASIIIYIWPEAWMCDPICTYFFAVIVCFTTIPVTKRCLGVLMEGTPEKFDTKSLIADIWALNLPDEEKVIIDVHDLHVWSISVGKLAMTVHVKST